jgi:TRAP-type C4-dicarboxylate transport system substrate-binding protein
MRGWRMSKKAAALALILSTGLFLSPAYALTIKLGTVAPEGSPWHDALQEMGAAWQEISGGQVKVRIYPGGVAGDEPDLLRKIRIGQLHAAALSKAGLYALAPDIDLISWPLMLRSDDELNHLLKTVGPKIEAQLMEKGFKVLNWSSAGWVYFFSRDPVVMPEDLQKQKLFFWGSDTEYVELLKQSGFQPVPLAINDLLPSLQTGLVDAFGAPPVVALSFQWFALTPNMADLKWQPLPGATVISFKTWRKIPAEQRSRLEKAAFDIGERLRGRIVKLNKDALEVMQEHGLKVNAVSAEEAAYWDSQFQQKAGDAFIRSRYSRDLYEEILQVLEEYRAGGSP